MADPLVLRAGPWEAGLAPAFGGAVTHLTRDGHDILRRTPEPADDPLAAACFPLLPYANRIARGRFDFAGRRHQLPLNFGDHPHSLHGIGWQSGWTVEAASETAATLQVRHDGGEGWPWRFRAEQHVRLDDDGLAITLLLANDGDDTMPAGIGLHPYFPRDPMTRLTFTATAMWLSDETMIPTHAAAADMFGDWRAGSGFPGRLVDNSFEGWSGQAAIESPRGTTRISAIGAPILHIYVPPDGDFLCVEPVSHLPDALNQGFAIDTLAPGETLALTIRIEA